MRLLRKNFFISKIKKIMKRGWKKLMKMVKNNRNLREMIQPQLLNKKQIKMNIKKNSKVTGWGYRRSYYKNKINSHKFNIRSSKYGYLFLKKVSINKPRKG